MSDEITIEQARGVIRRAYYADVEAKALEFKSRVESGEFETAGDFYIVFEQDIDSCFPYVADVYDCVYASRNSEESRETLLELGVTLDNPAFMTIWACETFRADVREHSEFPDWDTWNESREESES